MKIKRLHTTDAQQIYLNRVYPNTGLNRYFKPKGIWYGIDNAWFEWCDSENFGGIGKYTYELQVDLSEVIVIESPRQLIDFYNKFKQEIYSGSFGIDWLKVKMNYKGIEIRNYHAMRWRVLPFEGDTWFYGWDIDSGCIWNLTAITSQVRRKTSKKWKTTESTAPQQ